MFYQLRAVMQKEFAGYFRTPTAYIIIAVYLVLSMFATFYSAYFFAYDNSGLISFFTYQPEIFVVLMPAATMRLWADERRSGTIEFLLTQPVDYTAVVLGKFMAAAAFGLLMLALTLYQELVMGSYWGNILGYGTQMFFLPWLSLAAFMAAPFTNIIRIWPLYIIIWAGLFLTGCVGCIRKQYR